MGDSFTDTLATRIWSNQTFQADILKLRAQGLCQRMSVEDEHDHPNDGCIHKLLQSAAFLASSSHEQHRKTAYRIAIDIISRHSQSWDNLPAIIHTILARLGNFPAVTHLFSLLGQEKSYAFPSSVLFDLLHHEQQNTVCVGNRELLLTDFQRALWYCLDEKSPVSVSAPTSAGKSFALQNHLVRQFADGHLRFALYLVPTRALIHQVADALTGYAAHVTSEMVVATIPQPPKELGLERAFYVLTQERAHVLLEADPSIVFDLIVVDEAQTLGYGSRGVLLQVTLERLRRRCPTAQFFFGSPFSTNPEYFQFLLDDTIKQIHEKSSPVLQNLITADIDGKRPNIVRLNLIDDAQTVHLADVKLDHDVLGDEPALAYLSCWFGRSSKSLVYSGSPAKCEDVADKIVQWLKEFDSETTSDSDLQDFSKLVREHIHKDYALADMIEHGVAFHYGKMPTILRKAIEHYFVTNERMRFLVCTSTLLHGVNLPAHNLFILKPSEGNRWLSANSEPMKSSSFWNLAGRAGRMGKDFEGNVFLVNLNDWKENPVEGVREQTIRSALYSLIQEKGDEVIAAADRGDPNADREIEAAFVKLYCDFRKGRLEQVLIKSPCPLPLGFFELFRDKCAALSFTVPDDVVENNVSVAPVRQQRMLEYMLKSIDGGDIEKLIPPHPLSRDPYRGYVRLFSRFEKYFDGYDKARKSAAYDAAIALSWMRGMPYPQLIAKSKEKHPGTGLPTVIRNLMDTIETDLRFKAVQQARCYIDLLGHALTSRGCEEWIERIPRIALYLELGACSGTMVSLIGLGISRTTAGLLNHKAANRNMDRTKCFQWLRSQNWESSELPKICVREIQSLITKDVA